MPVLNNAILRAAYLAIVLGLTACSGGPPTVKIVGGGFIFNYRIAEAFYGVVAETGGDIPEGAILDAEFEDPAGGAAEYRREPIFARSTLTQCAGTCPICASCRRTGRSSSRDMKSGSRWACR